MTEVSGSDWTTSVRETYVVCHDGSDGGGGGEGVGVEGEANCLLHFELAGGADEGQFPHVGAPIVEDPSDVGLHGKETQYLEQNHLEDRNSNDTIW